jgi:hypothetical protein
MARGDLEGVIGAAAAGRATGRAQYLHLLGRYDWRSLETDALIGLGRLGDAETALAELEAALSPAGPPSTLVAAARLRGDLATAAGHGRSGTLEPDPAVAVVNRGREARRAGLRASG